MDIFFDLACRYAQACDRRDQQQLIALFTSDGQIINPYGTLSGHDEIGTIPSMLEQMFRATQHRVYNLTVDIDDSASTARGEVYCTANHLRSTESGLENESWAIRYQDSYIKQGADWLFRRRELIIDWVEYHPASESPTP